jgi:hypothetical protein
MLVAANSHKELLVIEPKFFPILEIKFQGAFEDNILNYFLALENSRSVLVNGTAIVSA